jgi:hypothetical protein
MTKPIAVPVALLKRILPWLPIAAILWSVVHFAVVGALRDYAERSLVAREVYLLNQQTQDRRLIELEECVKALDARLDAIEKKR